MKPFSRCSRCDCETCECPTVDADGKPVPPANTLERDALPVTLVVALVVSAIALGSLVGYLVSLGERALTQ